MGWGNSYPPVSEPTQIFFYNTDSCELKGENSAAVEENTLEKLWSPALFSICKIDITRPASCTYRGNNSFFETIAFLKQRNGRATGILALAFPATGRVTRNGKIIGNNVELENTELWHHDNSYQTFDMKQIIEETNVKALAIGVDTVRKGVKEFAGTVEK